MQKIILYLYLFLFCIPAIGQNSSNFTNDATLITNQDNTAIVLSSGIHEKKKEAVQMAVLSAFDTYFFSGITGLNDDNPLFGENNDKALKDYLERFFLQGRYTQFIGTCTEVEGSPEKLPTKQFKATVQVELKLKALGNDLKRNKLIKPKLIKPTEIDAVVPQFTLTVVPFKPEGHTYAGILKSNFEIRSAMAQVEGILKEKNYATKDFLAVVDAAYKSNQFETDKTAGSMDKLLLEQTNADVYITVDLAKNENNEGGIVYVNIKAYELSSGNLLSSAEGQSNRYRKFTIADLCKRAIDSTIDPFMAKLTKSWADKADKGNIYVLRMSIAPEATIDFSNEVGTMGFPLSDILTLWVKQHAHNGRYHLQGVVDNQLNFDQVQIESGKETQFGTDLYTYLRDELGINCNKRQDGNTIYITIQ